MTTYPFTIGGVDMPLPSQGRGLEMEYFPLGISGRMASGAYRVQYVTSKWRVRIVWEGLTTAERATVWAAYGGYIATATTVVLPDGTTFSGFVDLASWAQAQWFNPHVNQVLYNVTFVIVEA